MLNVLNFVFSNTRVLLELRNVFEYNMALFLLDPYSTVLGSVSAAQESGGAYSTLLSRTTQAKAGISTISGSKKPKTQLYACRCGN